MTDRLKGCTVTFTSDIREDDAERILDAIRQIRGVADVTGKVSVSDDHFARMRIVGEVHREFAAVLNNLSSGDQASD